MTELIRVDGTENEQRLGDIVFVHGLNGDARATWQYDEDDGSFWPQLLYNDLPNFGVWSFGYDADASKWFGHTMPIVDRATNLAAFLRSEGVGKRPLFFVVHSLGGLVVKQMLRALYDQNHDDPLVVNTKGIFFFGTPHMGSKLSNFMQMLGLYRPSTSVEELEYADSRLRDLNHWYRGNAPKLDIATVVFAETRKVKNTVVVVDQVSSDPGIPGVIPITVDCDHIELCKVDTESMPYKTVRNQIQEYGRGHERSVSIKEKGDLWVDVSCFNKYPDQWEEKTYPKHELQIISYETTRSDDVISIKAVLPYLTELRNGEPMWSLEYMWTPFRWLPVTLDFKLLNRGSETLYLSRLELHVERSRPDFEPIPFIKQVQHFPYIHIQNDGWGHVKSAELRLAFADGVGKPDFPDSFPHSITLPGFEGDGMSGGSGVEIEGIEVDLTQPFIKEGVDIDAVIGNAPNANRGPFKSGVAYIYGELTMDVTDVGSRVFNFGTYLRLQPPVMGMYGPPTFEYHAKLKVNADNYVVPIDISHVLKSGDPDRLLVQLAVDQTSNHRLKLRFCGSGPSIDVETPVEIEMLVPRSAAGNLAKPEDSTPSF